jgi:hypothetical protein
MNKDTILIDDLDNALIGFCMTWHGEMLVERAIYSGEIIAQMLVETNDLDEEQAIEFIETEMVSHFVGETTPIIMWPILNEQDETVQ